jgi:hypothetical protein
VTPEELHQAEDRLAERPEYEWLTGSATEWFITAEVSRHTGVSRNTVRFLCESGRIPGAVFYGPDIGWRIPRSGLIEFFSGLPRGSSPQPAF